MADPWRPTLRKRLTLFAVDVAARIARGVRGRGTSIRLSNADVREILVIELWNIGDLVLTIPFLAELRGIFPAAKITLLARPYAREVLGATALVDDFIVANLGWSDSNRTSGPLAYAGEMRRVAGELRRGSFDIAFKSRAHVREHILLAITRARRKIAYSLGAGDAVLTDAIPRDIGSTHKVEDWLGLLAPFGGPLGVAPPRLQTSRADLEWAKSFLAKPKISPTDRVVGVHPGASIAEKRWPLGKFARVAEELRAASGQTVIAFADENDFGAELGAINGVVLARGLTIPRLIALLSHCDILVCNDSGPMHLAAAMNVPVVAVFADAIPRWFAPLGDGHALLVPRPGESIDSIDEAAVLAAASKALRG